eukprot:TRINITY_DN66893_c6_g1_i2.p1 TRINITY_DN66893_c6_g1~~TRINITY_DN66893_c6_g1_i2.p1  ORF type:complete len:436 (+),score=43.94 TRINITY_DN66893_c6_g1_i2:29-1309(+)
MNIELDYQTADSLRQQWGTPLYVYDERKLRQNARKLRNLRNAFGLTPRFAIKACPTQAVLQIFDQEGLHFDASSTHEVERAITVGVHPSHIGLSTQQLNCEHVRPYLKRGLSINACSLHQLEALGKNFPGMGVGLRVNPGFGSGHSKKATVAGPTASFGVWFGHLDRAKAIAEKYNLTIRNLHMHIGSGVDPKVWQKAVQYVLAEVVPKFPTMDILNLGGGFKVARVPTEVTTDIDSVAAEVADIFTEYAKRTGRKFHLEVEPGTALVADTGVILTTVQDMTSTKNSPTDEVGFDFLKVDAGMTDILRPTVYASQHPIEVLKGSPSTGKTPVVVVGHCCESGDLITPSPDDPSEVATRNLDRANIGDMLVIGYTGAYCSAMSAKNYNSFPEAPEVLLTESEGPKLIRSRQSMQQIIQNELPLYSKL